jgi:UDP-N-acetylglucosamine 2-epimerase (non-hydrolysing)/GDP/UDP-N,N'-diacetylbacillosamine 2-epimerase (hydrolysing)
MRKIAVVTGTRAEYGYLKPLMEEIQKDRQLELIPVITGMHLLQDYGDTYKIVEQDFSNSIKVKMPLAGDSGKDMANYLSNGIKNLVESFEEIKPDIVTALGDRSEAFAAALAATYLNIPFAHINGGDVSGTTIDESIRHAITKFAHIHLVHTKNNAERVKKMGEQQRRIFVTGALTLDTIFQTKLMNRKEIFEKHNLDPYATTFLVVHHPITTLKDRGFSQIKELLSALDNLQKQTVLIYPNCDAGSQNFIDLIESYENKKYLTTFKSLPHNDYLSFMKNCDLMIGNSSSGIIEAPSFKIPVINIGSRQQGRERSDNIIDVEPKKNNILKKIDFALNDKKFKNKVNNCVNKFGDGKASTRIVKIFKEIEISDKLIQKQITY